MPRTADSVVKLTAACTAKLFVLKPELDKLSSNTSLMASSSSAIQILCNFILLIVYLYRNLDSKYSIAWT